MHKSIPELSTLEQGLHWFTSPLGRHAVGEIMAPHGRNRVYMCGEQKGRDEIDLLGWNYEGPAVYPYEDVRSDAE